MRPINLPRESLGTGATVWEVAGQSPANSPQAVIQAIQTLLGILSNPLLGPPSGLQVWPLVQAFIAESPLKNLMGVQLSESETKARNQTPTDQGAAAGSALGPGGDVPPNDGGMAGPPGDAGVPVLPSLPAG